MSHRNCFRRLAVIGLAVLLCGVIGTACNVPGGTGTTDLDNPRTVTVTLKAFFDPDDLRDPRSTLPLVKRSVEMSDGENARQLDTLPLTCFMKGDTTMAIETQE